MKSIILYVVDDKHEALWANVPALQRFLDCPTIKVEPLTPFPQFPQFNYLLKNPNLGGFFIDQKMKGRGVVNYNGIELAEYLRGLYPKLPIYILTGYPEEDFSATAYRVEDIIEKATLDEGNSDRAKMVKARILRRLDVFDDVLNVREKRFHELLVKSIKEPLSQAEEKELGLLETERVAPLCAGEMHDVKELQKKLAELEVMLQRDNWNL